MVVDINLKSRERKNFSRKSHFLGNYLAQPPKHMMPGFTRFSKKLKQVQHPVSCSLSDQNPLAVTHLLHKSRIIIHLMELHI